MKPSSHGIKILLDEDRLRTFTKHVDDQLASTAHQNPLHFLEHSPLWTSKTNVRANHQSRQQRHFASHAFVRLISLRISKAVLRYARLHQHNIAKCNLRLIYETVKSWGDNQPAIKTNRTLAL